MTLGLELARASTQGDYLPSDDLLQRLLRTKTNFGPLANLVPDNMNLTIPGAVREAFATLTSPSTTALTNAGVLPYMNQMIGTLEQIPLLMEEVSFSSLARCLCLYQKHSRTTI